MMRMQTQASVHSPAAPSTSSPDGVATRVRWTLIAPTLLVVWIISMFDKSNISLVIADPQFIAEFNLAGQQTLLGLLGSGLLFAYGLGAPVWGWIVYRAGARWTLIVSLAVWAVACALSGIATSYATLLFSRVLLGFGEAALYPVTLALVANWFALKERGRATSYWWIGTMIGPMLAGVVITFLITTFGWRNQFFDLAVLALVVPLPMVLWLVRDHPRQHARVNSAERAAIIQGSLENNVDAPGRLHRAGVSNTLHNYRFWLVTLAIGTNAIFFWGWSTWLPTYLRTARAFSFSTSGYLTFVIYGCATLTILGVGFYSDRIFRRAPLAALGWVVGAVFLIAAALVDDNTLSVVFIILALCAQQVGISSAEMLMHSVVGAADMGATQGVRAFITQMIGAISPALIGALVEANRGSFVAAFAVLAGAVVISAAFMITLARQHF
ncbi:MAG: MFS transporter [Chloroflexota bacterium]